MSNDRIVEIFKRKCDVCGELYDSDKWGQGKCQNCGWYGGFYNIDNSDRVVFPNYVSLNKAKKLYKEGKERKPNIYDFMGMLGFYSETEFKYKGKIYGVINSKYNGEDIIELYKAHKDTFARFKNEEEFIEKANIDGIVLKDIWDTEISDADYLH